MPAVLGREGPLSPPFTLGRLGGGAGILESTRGAASDTMVVLVASMTIPTGLNGWPGGGMYPMESCLARKTPD